MTNWPETNAEMLAFYGKPYTDGGLADPAWEAANLVSIDCPWLLSIEWAPTTKTRHIRCHVKVSASLARILDNIWTLHGRDQARIEQQGMHLYSGCYNFRAQRGSSPPILSKHAFAAAIDFNATANPLGRAWKAGMMSIEVVRIFENEGWVWGGRWRRPDCQHFQAAK